MIRHRRSLELQAEMNLTNLLDTAFVLLIAFMLMAPMLKNGIQLNLPKIGGTQIATQQTTVTISIAKPLEGSTDDTIYIEDIRQTYDQVTKTLQQKQQSIQDFSVVIEADRDVRYDTVAHVLARVKKLGIKSVGLVTDTK